MSWYGFAYHDNNLVPWSELNARDREDAITQLQSLYPGALHYEVVMAPDIVSPDAMTNEEWRNILKEEDVGNALVLLTVSDLLKHEERIRGVANALIALCSENIIVSRASEITLQECYLIRGKCMMIIDRLNPELMGG